MNKKLGLLAIPVVVGLGVIGAISLNPTAHATPVPTPTTTTIEQQSVTAEAPETTAEAVDSSAVDDPNGPNVEQTGQNESAN